MNYNKTKNNENKLDFRHANNYLYLHWHDKQPIGRVHVFHKTIVEKNENER